MLGTGPFVHAMDGVLCPCYGWGLVSMLGMGSGVHARDGGVLCPC